MPSRRGIVRRRVLRPAHRRLLADPHVLLGIAIAISTTVIEGAESLATAIPVGLAGVAYVSLQVYVASHRRFLRSVSRLLIALGFLFGLAVVNGPTHAVPLTLLTLPIVALAARYGRREALVLGIAAVSLPLIPALAGIEQTPVVLARGSAFVATTFLVAFGTRLTVEAMEAAVRRARASFARERRRARQMAGVEAVGRLLANAVLRAFGAMLAARFRASDIVARYGGEEFLVVLDGASLDEARRAAEDVRAAFAAASIDAPSGKLSATVSAGCSAIGPSVASVSTLLEVADVALQMAKRGGRNQVVAA